MISALLSYLVTGDPDLRDLGQFEDIEIVDVRTFVTLVGEQG